MGYFSRCDTTLREEGMTTPALRYERRQATPTPSQYASAACHLERRSEWQFFWSEGVRYVAVVSGRTANHVHAVRADARGCSCTWYKTTYQQCSHMLSLELAALEDNLREPAPVSLVELRALYPGCAAGCGNLVESSGLSFCDECSARRAHERRMAAARAKVLASWTTEED